MKIACVVDLILPASAPKFLFGNKTEIVIQLFMKSGIQVKFFYFSNYQIVDACVLPVTYIHLVAVASSIILPA